jgi:SulP family sulfate permease
VIIQIFLLIFQSAERMTIMELVPTKDGDFIERPAPKSLPSDQVTMLLPHGSLFFAAAIDFEEEAPTLEGANHAAVIVTLRGREQLGSTAIIVFERFAKALRETDSQLFLAEVSDSVRKQLERTDSLEVIGAENVLPAGEKILASLNQVYADAHKWLEETSTANDNE